LASRLVTSWWSILPVSVSTIVGSNLFLGAGLHVVEVCDLAVLVTNDWEGEVGSGDLVDVLDPSSVALDGVGREANQLDATLGELWLELGESTQLGGADGSVVLWVGEENNPFVADELMEVDWALGGLSLEVWGDGAQTEAAETTLADVAEDDVVETGMRNIGMIRPGILHPMLSARRRPRWRRRP
jgi:hypothetical protein